MLKSILLAIPIMLSLPALAQKNQDKDWFDASKPVACGPFREIVKNLMKDPIRETPLWIGKSSEDVTHFALFYNPKTTSWTLVQYGTEVGCVLGIGNTSDIVDLSALQKIH